MAALALVDTNVLLRLLQPHHRQYPMALAAVAELRNRLAELCIAPQNLVEFWVVATRPVVNNGLGMSPLAIAGEVRALNGMFRLLEGKAGVSGVWETLAGKYFVSGKQAHDTHLVAVMQIHGVKDILTFNIDHFSRFAEINVIDATAV
jgi:predicted nucleic acid-binding protein